MRRSGARLTRRRSGSAFSDGARRDLGETGAEAAFLDEFFRQTWGYIQAGTAGAEAAFSLHPRFPVPGGAVGGGNGVAEAALGHFENGRMGYVPQVLCEFKGISNKGLDAPQSRKNDTRSPVQQGLGYLSAAPAKGATGPCCRAAPR